MADDTTLLPAVQDEEITFLDVASGEFLPATPENAAAVIAAARERKHRLDDIIRDATRWLAERSATFGTKTIHTEHGKIEIKGGTTIEYDPQKLEETLAAAGLPEERIREVVVATVTYKVDKRILRQITAANPAYAKAAEEAATTVETPISASVSAAGRSR